MTLIVSLATQDFVLLVGDMRITERLPDKTYRVKEDHQNKLTYYNSRIAFGYCGLGMIKGMATDKWIAKQLQQTPSPYTAADAIHHLRLQATEAFRLEPLVPETRMAIVGVGWNFDAPGSPGYAAIWHISNFSGEDGSELEIPKRDFRLDTTTVRPNESARMIFSPASLTIDLQKNFQRAVKRHIRANVSPIQIVKRTVRFVREVSSDIRSRGTVGKNLLSIYLPSSPQPTVVQGGQPLSIGMAMMDSGNNPSTLMLGGIPDGAAHFHYWGYTQPTKLSIGQNIVIPGNEFVSEIASAVSQFMTVPSGLS